MTPIGDWGEIIDEAEAERFVGREEELEFFHHHINLIPPRYLIFYISGQGGVGKSTLLNRYREICKNLDFLLAECDEQQKDVPDVLGRFSHQLTEQGFSLKQFSERYKTYQQKMDEIENDPQAPQGLPALLGRTFVRAVYIGGDFIPGLRKGLDYLPQEAAETQASQWAEYLAKKLTNKDELALVRDPVPILTSLFFDDLNAIAQRRRVLLCFENFEATKQELQGWLLRLRKYKPSQNIRIVIAGRDKPGASWDPLRAVTATNHLDVFSMLEAEAFLDLYNIRDPKRRTEILEWSGRLPVLMSWLAAPEGEEPDPLVPTSDIVERFLRWVTQPAMREVALRVAIPRTFNLDVLGLLLDKTDNKIDGQTAFDWLQTMPFVSQHHDGWQYHEVVRRMMLHYQRQKSPEAYQQIHTTMASFYNTKRNKLDLSQDEQWADQQWRKDTLAYIYHSLAADPIHHWMEIVSLFTRAVRKRRSFAVEIIELMLSNDVHDELSKEQQNQVQLFHMQLRAIKDGSLKDGFEMFHRLCNMSGLSLEAKGYAFAYRGRCYQLRREFEKAIADFENALTYITTNAWIINNRGETYREMGRYEEALADFNQVLALDDKNIDALIDRGLTYLLMHSYNEALADLNQVLSEDKSKLNLFYMELGLLLSYLGRYSEAIESYEQGLKEVPANYRSLYNIAVALMRWKGLPDAQIHIDRARPILLSLVDSGDCGAALYGLGGLEAIADNTDQALDYLRKAIPLEQEAIEWARHDVAWLDLRPNSDFRSLIS